MAHKEIIKITDKHGFVYEVELRYQPYYGLVFAYYDENVIADAQGYQLRQPLADDDAQWQRYEESFAEFRDQSKVDIYPMCKQYFDKIH